MGTVLFALAAVGGCGIVAWAVHEVRRAEWVPPRRPRRQPAQVTSIRILPAQRVEAGKRHQIEAPP